MARGRQRRESLISSSYSCPVCSDNDPDCPACGGGPWPGGINPHAAIKDMGGLEGITSGGTGPTGGWGGGH